MGPGWGGEWDLGKGGWGGGVLLSQRLIGFKPQGNAAADWSPEATSEREISTARLNFYPV